MRISYALREIGRSIGRNRTRFILAASVQAVCLTLLSVFLVVTLNIASFVRSAGRQIQLHVFVSDAADVSSLQGRIGHIAGVASTRFVSKDEALAELRAELGEDAATVEALGSNPLPASVRVSLLPGYAAPQALAELEQKIGLLPGVTEVWSGRESLAKLDRVLRTAVGIGIAILVIVSCSVAFVVFQSVSSSISSRAREIEIMELVGAGRAMVRIPFIAEGMLQALVAGLAAFILTLVLYRFAAAALPAPLFPAGPVFGFDLVLGCLLGLLGSLFALSRIRK